MNSSAIVIENLSLTYKRGKSTFYALKDININVEDKSIYGLIGPSGCGKSSILSCCLGVCTPKSGTIKIFGHAPHEKGLGIPGPRIGYMPQDYTLHTYFNSKELLYYYCRIFSVPNAKSEIETLLKRLDLFDGKMENRQVTQLSGGEQRRLSIACSLIHKPQIIFLDEPTVGVDPVLGVEIWNLLKELVNQSSTIVITTHYMDEASKANRIGFIRDGEVMYEGTPQAIKDKYNLQLLDDVFLQMCIEYQDAIDDNPSTPTKVVINKLKEKSNDEEAKEAFLKPENFQPQKNNLNHVFWALVFKNLMILRRHTWFMLFQALLPAITLIIFLLCIGQPMHGLKLAIINEDNRNCENEVVKIPCVDYFSYFFSSWDNSAMSCNIVHYLDDYTFSTKEYVSSLEEAIDTVVYAKTHGYIHFEQGFAEAFFERIQARITLSSINETVLDKSQMNVQIDATNTEIAKTIYIKVHEAFSEYFLDYAHQCNITNLAKSLFFTGLDFKSIQEIQGVDNPDIGLSESIMPAMMSLSINLLAIALTADILMSEKEAGVLTRDYVCGVPMVLYLISQIFTFFLVAAFQILFSLILLGVIYKGLPVGIFIFLAILLSLQSICGMTMGLFLTSLLKSREQVIQAGSAYVFPAFVLSGVVWPFMTMPYWLQVIAICLPTTYACNVARYVTINQRVRLFDGCVSIGISLIWTGVLFTLCFLIIRKWGFKV